MNRGNQESGIASTAMAASKHQHKHGISHGGQSVATGPGATDVRDAKSMHVRTGSTQLNPMKKKDGEMSESRLTPSLENQDLARVGIEVGGGVPVEPSNDQSELLASDVADKGQKKSTINQLQTSLSKMKDLNTDGRNSLTQFRSQEKKQGDRQSVPNIEETIVVQLPQETMLKPDEPQIDKLLQRDGEQSELFMLTDDDKLKKMGEEEVRRDNTHTDASNEVRNLLEYLYLDVKVRSPAEIAELTD